MYGYAWATAHVQRSEDNLAESDLSFHHVGPRDRTWVTSDISHCAISQTCLVYFFEKVSLTEPEMYLINWTWLAGQWALRTHLSLCLPPSVPQAQAHTIILSSMLRSRIWSSHAWAVGPLWTALSFKHHRTFFKILNKYTKSIQEGSFICI